MLVVQARARTLRGPQCDKPSCWRVKGNAAIMAKEDDHCVWKVLNSFLTRQFFLNLYCLGEQNIILQVNVAV